MNALRAFFGGSKKASTVVLGLLIVLFRDVLGLSDDMAKEIAMIIIAFIFGQSVVDLGLALKGLKR